MSNRVYVETTIVSYLTARPMRDLVAAARQEMTTEWWELRRGHFELYVSDAVLEEASRGDSGAAARRLEALQDVPVLETTADALDLAAHLVHIGIVPEKARVDALHIALATVHGTNYLLTWNCAHIANAELEERLRAALIERGFVPPVICTPEELMGDRHV